MKKQKKIIIGIISALLVLTAVAGGILLGLSVESIFKQKEKEALLVEVGWYSEDGEEFTITTVDELYDVVALSEYYSFEGQTIKLGADLIINEGNADEWKKDAAERKWLPIRDFAGTFDGDGHTISGLYGYGADYEMGMFSNTKPKAVIRNFKLLNSYFKSSGEKVGAISSNGSGTFLNIYTDAIVVTDAPMGAGGFIGKIDAAGESAVVGYYTRFTGCWFDGEVILQGNHGAFGGGFVGNFSSGTLEMKQCLSSAKISSVTTIRAPHMGGFIGDTNVDVGTVILSMEGCLNTSEIKANNINTCAAVVGRLRAKCTAEFINCYSTQESLPERDSIGAENTFTGNILRFSEKVLKGYGGYEWTNLDFENYWSVVMEDTPILQAFAEEIPSLEGITKAYSTDWYDKYSDELIIDSREKFFGLFILPYTDAVTYRGQTIKLACDITINEGKASDWTKEAPLLPWLPIGNWNTKFEGNFDGQGHTISGIYTEGKNYVGLFGVTAQGTVLKNFKLVNSCMKGDGIVGSVVGRTLGDIDGIYSDAIVISTGAVTGGIAGQSLEPKSAPVKHSITNCWFDGQIEAIGEAYAYAGGILGDNRNNHVTIAHCLNTGNITTASNRYSPFVGGINGSTTNEGAVTLIDDCLNVGTLSAPNSEAKNFIGSIIGYSKDNNTKVTNSYATEEAWQKATSYVAEKRSVSGQWPIAKLIGYGGYDWTTLDFKNYWAVVSDGTPVLKRFATKVPSVAGRERKIDISWYDEKKDVYVIDSAADLVGFNMIARGTDFEGKTIKLGADIVLNQGLDLTKTENVEVLWTPVGTWDIQFKGTFDGQGHTIRGICAEGTTYVGFFGVTAKGSIVKNFRLEDSYIKGTSVVGGVVGRALGDVEGVYCSADIVSTEGIAGGIVAQSLDTKEAPLKISIKNCWFDGTVEVTAEGFAYAGGILGDNRNNHVTIAHCLNSGSLTTASNRYSPIMGGIHGTTTNEGAVTLIDDCLSVGTLSAPKSEAKNCVASIIGNSKDAKTKVTNSYATVEGWSKATSYIASKRGLNGQWPEKQLIGKGGYEWTTLDFDNYWTIVADGTPILKSFATTISSVSGERKIDVSWYDEAKDTYILDSNADFVGFNMIARSTDFAGKTVKLGVDIKLNVDLDVTKPESVEFQWTPVGNFDAPFKGIFDGQGHQISGISVKGTNYVGLFGAIAQKSVVKNFKLVNSYIEGSMIVGGVVGRTLGNIEGVYCSADVVSTEGIAGGIAGQSLETKDAPLKLSIKNCQYDGTLHVTTDGFAYAGGILGDNRNNHVTIAHCLFSGELVAESNRYNVNLGGINGITMNEGAVTKVTDCLSTGTIKADKSANKARVGSLIGFAVDTKTKVVDSYATKECWSAATTWIGGVRSSAGQMLKTNIFGLKGYTNTTLDFEKYWVAVEDATPELQSFATGKILNAQGKQIDISWYDTTENATFKLETKEQFLGFVLLSQQYNFKTQTIELCTDVKLNDGDAKTWGDPNNAPGNIWTPIGSVTNEFAGTFEGNGHIIKGLYMNTTDNCTGLFAATAVGSTVRNFKLINSYLENTNASAAVMGSIAGRINGDMDSIYSDAIIVSVASHVGGIVGQVFQPTEAMIANCWFAGSLTGNGVNGKYLGGIVGNHRNGTLTIAHCLNTATITCEDPDIAGAALPHIGGIIGLTEKTLILDDCFNGGDIDNKRLRNASGSILGRGNGTSDVTITDTYATTESYELRTVAMDNMDALDGAAVALPHKSLEGKYGYLNTTLDFDEEKYWVAIEGDTPELELFSTAERADLTNAHRPDTSWYDTTPNKTFELDTVEKFLGFQQLSREHNFATQTVKLVLDEVVLNTGDADDWYDESKAPDNIWQPIGSTSNPFAGIFDGNGATISGLYMKTPNAYVGLFGATAAGSELKDFYLKNSYLETTNTGDSVIGSIAGRVQGTVTNVYSEANVVSAGTYGAGLVGQMNAAGAKLDTCWYNGSLYMSATTASNGIGGLVALVNGTGASADTPAIIEHSLFTGSIHSNIELVAGSSYATFERLGGFVGFVRWGGYLKITDSLSAGEITTNQYKKTEKTRAISATFGQCTDGDSGIIFDSGVYATSSCFGILAPSGHRLTGSVTEFTNAMNGTIHNLNAEKWTAVSGATPILTRMKDKVAADVSGIVNADVSWYDNVSGKTYLIDTMGKFYGFMQLAQTNNFANQTVKLGINIILNADDGNAENWGVNAPDYEWKPIPNFAGTFDGDGHTISGVYIKDNGDFLAMFKNTAIGSEIKNFRLVNSYIEGTKRGPYTAGWGYCSFIASVISRCQGNLTNVSSDAIVVSHGNIAGGLVANIFNNSASPVISHCEFGGTLYMKANTEEQATRAGGIIGMVQSCSKVVVEHCLFSGSIDSKLEKILSGGSWYSFLAKTGGIAGYVTAPMEVNDCISAGTITVTQDTQDTGTRGTGSILGQSSSTVNFTGPVYATIDCHHDKSNNAVYWTAGTAGLTNVDNVKVYDDSMKGTIGNLSAEHFEAVEGAIPKLKDVALSVRRWNLLDLFK